MTGSSSSDTHPWDAESVVPLEAEEMPSRDEFRGSRSRRRTLESRSASEQDEAIQWNARKGTKLTRAQRVNKIRRDVTSGQQQNDQSELRYRPNAAGVQNSSRASADSKSLRKHYADTNGETSLPAMVRDVPKHTKLSTAARFRKLLANHRAVFEESSIWAELLNNKKNVEADSDEIKINSFEDVSSIDRGETKDLDAYEAGIEHQYQHSRAEENIENFIGQVKARVPVFNFPKREVEGLWKNQIFQSKRALDSRLWSVKVATHKQKQILEQKSDLEAFKQQFADEFNIVN
jgi:hypothetical protein